MPAQSTRRSANAASFPRRRRRSRPCSIRADHRSALAAATARGAARRAWSQQPPPRSLQRSEGSPQSPAQAARAPARERLNSCRRSASCTPSQRRALLATPRSWVTHHSSSRVVCSTDASSLSPSPPQVAQASETLQSALKRAAKLTATAGMAREASEAAKARKRAAQQLNELTQARPPVDTPLRPPSPRGHALPRRAACRAALRPLASSRHRAVTRGSPPPLPPPAPPPADPGRPPGYLHPGLPQTRQAAPVRARPARPHRRHGALREDAPARRRPAEGDARVRQGPRSVRAPAPAWRRAQPPPRSAAPCLRRGTPPRLRFPRPHVRSCSPPSVSRTRRRRRWRRSSAGARGSTRWRPFSSGAPGPSTTSRRRGDAGAAPPRALPRHSSRSADQPRSARG